MAPLSTVVGSLPGVQTVTDLAERPWPGQRAVITIGAYDGVHIGHRAVIEHVRERAAQLGALSTVVQ